MNSLKLLSGIVDHYANNPEAREEIERQDREAYAKELAHEKVLDRIDHLQDALHMIAGAAVLIKKATEGTAAESVAAAYVLPSLYDLDSDTTTNRYNSNIQRLVTLIVEEARPTAP
jgi:hypothetical protein